MAGPAPKKMRRTLLGYLPIESPIHTFHPIIKTFFLLIISMYPLLIDSPEWNIVGIVAMFAVFIASKVQLSILKFYTTVMLNIFWIIFIAYTFFGGYSPGYHVLARVGPILISWENIWWAITVYLKMFFAILVIVYFLSVSRERDVVLGLRWLRAPYVIAYMIGLALRSIGLSLIDFNTIREAEKARALDLKALPLTHKIKKFGLYIVPLVALALRRTDEVSNALDSRGFKFTGLRGYKRTDYLLSKYRFGGKDLVAVALMLGILAAILYFRYLTTALTPSSSMLLQGIAGLLGVK
ncbi:MAG: energy-coupling factor transporter transmembrane protein EcfT [Desulfurococcales archaeon]|nr:energy-coupling factor transporter transmembrane protein EcfT [Desulfurococcales archaeon]